MVRTGFVVLMRNVITLVKRSDRALTVPRYGDAFGQTGNSSVEVGTGDMRPLPTRSIHPVLPMRAMASTPLNLEIVSITW